MRRVGLAAVAASLALGLAPAGAAAAALESIGTFSSPVYVTSEPQDPDRLFVVEKGGRIILVENGNRTEFLDIAPQVESVGEQGLLSMALAPDFADSGRYYAFYTPEDGVDNDADLLRVSEFTASGDDGGDGTERMVIEVPHTTAANHNAGQLQFGPDDLLYISIGDGGNTPLTARDLTSHLGKILRIDPAGDSAGEYTVPADNPFVGVAGAAPEIWSSGLRNPYRFSFDSATGALLIGDVGATRREEVNYVPAPDRGEGDDFGWNCREGTLPLNPSCSGNPGFTEPIFDYDIAAPEPACAITGGYVVHDPGIPELAGRYVYADFCVGQVRSLVPALPLATGDRSEGLSVASPSSFGQDSCGRVYVASLTGGVARLVGATPTDCAMAAGDPPGGGDPGGGGTGPGDPGAGDPGGAPVPPASADGRAPRLELKARDRQRLAEDRELACRIIVDEAASARARLALVAGDRVLARLDRKDAAIVPDRKKRLVWKVPRAVLRAVKRPLRKKRLEARFRARAIDAAANRGPRAEASSEVR